MESRWNKLPDSLVDESDERGVGLVWGDAVRDGNVRLCGEGVRLLVLAGLRDGDVGP